MVAQIGHKFGIVREKGERTAERDKGRYPRLRAESHTIWTVLYQRALETLKRGPGRVVRLHTKLNLGELREAPNSACAHIFGGAPRVGHNLGLIEPF